MTLAGVGAVGDEDVVEFQAGLGFTSLAFDGSSASVAEVADLDAFNRRTASEWLLSFDVPGTIGASSYDDADLLVWNPLLSSFADNPWFDAGAGGIAERIDLVAVEATPGQVPVELQQFSIE